MTARVAKVWRTGAIALALGASLVAGCDLAGPPAAPAPRVAPVAPHMPPPPGVARQILPPADGMPGWSSDFHSALASARQSRRKVCVDFSARWCPPCKKLKDEVLVSPGVRNAMGDFERVYVDIETNRELASRFQVSGTPTIVFLSSDGNELARQVGFVDEQGFMKLVNRARQSN